MPSKYIMIIIISSIINLLKPHVRRTYLHNKNITNETHRVILIKKELK